MFTAATILVPIADAAAVTLDAAKAAELSARAAKAAELAGKAATVTVDGLKLISKTAIDIPKLPIIKDFIDRLKARLPTTDARPVEAQFPQRNEPGGADERSVSERPKAERSEGADPRLDPPVASSTAVSGTDHDVGGLGGAAPGDGTGGSRQNFNPWQHGNDRGANSGERGPEFSQLTADQQMSIAQEEISQGAVTFDSDPQAAAYGSHVLSGDTSALSAEQRVALHDYTSSPPHFPAYTDINRALRGERMMTPEVASEVQSIDEAISGHPLPQDIVVTRGTDLDHIEGNVHSLAGETVHERAYLSTSLGSPAFSAKEATLHLRVPAGTDALYLERVSAAGGGERELLLGRDTKYQVTRVVYDEATGWQLYGEVIAP